ncbi:MAG: hypothetical protein K8R52_10270, partial [Bacteroidales bacterium]|nr:hypothetical protein [Bacteroidales bacterium]
MSTRSPVFLLLLFSISYTLTGQNRAVNRTNYRLHALKTDQPVEIDGILDEAIWSRAEKTSPFHRITPIDTGYAIAQT